jgi:hypothetical protein
LETRTAKKIGQLLAAKSVIIGLVIAYIIFGWFTFGWDKNLIKSVCWIFYVEFWYHLLIGAFGLITMAYFFGRLAGTEILIKGRNAIISGIKYGFIILITGTLIGSSVGLFRKELMTLGASAIPFLTIILNPCIG